MASHAKWLPLLKRLSVAKRKLINAATVKKCLVAENNNQEDAEPVETGKDAEVGPPVKLEEEQT